jgi:hypothetical protein
MSGLIAARKAFSYGSNNGRSGSRYRPIAPQTSPPRVRSAAIISWSPPKVMLACQRGLELGSPPVASYNVEIPYGECATSTSWLTSSSAYSIAIHSGGNSGIPSWKWLVIRLDAGSMV